MKYTVFLFLLASYIVTGCDSQRTTIYLAENCADDYQQVNFNLIMNAPEKYDSSFVEITGFYKQAFEASAVANSKINDLG